MSVGSRFPICCVHYRIILKAQESLVGMWNIEYWWWVKLSISIILAIPCTILKNYVFSALYCFYMGVKAA